MRGRGTAESPPGGDFLRLGATGTEQARTRGSAKPVGALLDLRRFHRRVRKIKYRIAYTIYVSMHVKSYVYVLVQ